MEKIKILYIDDTPDITLSRFLDEYTQCDYEFTFSDIEFIPENGYDSLINNPEVRSANIIFIDSRLFDNRTAIEGKFTGEEFKMILKKYFPFIEVIVITQNNITEGYETVSKYIPGNTETARDYYSKVIPLKIEVAVKNIYESRLIAIEMRKNTEWESVLIEKITNSLNGCGAYDELTKGDINEAISLFREIQEKIDGGRL